MKPYLTMAGTARNALELWQSVFGGQVSTYSFAEMGRDDGPADAIAHGMLTGPVSLFSADAAEGESAFEANGLLFSLLGAAEPDVLRGWFNGLSVGGEVLDPLQKRPWGDWDGQVRDAFGVAWLIGFEASALEADQVEREGAAPDGAALDNAAPDGA